MGMYCKKKGIREIEITNFFCMESRKTRRRLFSKSLLAGKHEHGYLFTRTSHAKKHE